MSVSWLRNIVAVLLLFLTPAALVANDFPSTAMVYGKGSVSINGAPLPGSSAILPGDMIETKSDGIATVNAEGSNLIIEPDSAAKFGPDGILLDHGSVSIATSKQMVGRALNATATPSSIQWTEFELSTINGSVEVVARKGEVEVNCGKETAHLSEGQSVANDSSGRCERRKKTAGAYPPAEGNILSSPYLKYIAAAAGGGILIWILLPKSHAPASPAIP